QREDWRGWYLVLCERTRVSQIFLYPVCGEIRHHTCDVSSGCRVVALGLGDLSSREEVLDLPGLTPLVEDRGRRICPHSRTTPHVVSPPVDVLGELFDLRSRDVLDSHLVEDLFGLWREGRRNPVSVGPPVERHPRDRVTVDVCVVRIEVHEPVFCRYLRTRTSKAH